MPSHIFISRTADPSWILLKQDARWARCATQKALLKRARGGDCLRHGQERAVGGGGGRGAHHHAITASCIHAIMPSYIKADHVIVQSRHKCNHVIMQSQHNPITPFYKCNLAIMHLRHHAISQSCIYAIMHSHHRVTRTLCWATGWLGDWATGS